MVSDHQENESVIQLIVLNYSGKDPFNDLQVNEKGAIEDFTWKHSAVRFPLRGSNGSWMSDSFHVAMKVTGADPVKFLMSGRSMECSRCDNLVVNSTMMITRTMICQKTQQKALKHLIRHSRDKIHTRLIVRRVKPQ